MKFLIFNLFFLNILIFSCKSKVEKQYKPDFSFYKFNGQFISEACKNSPLFYLDVFCNNSGIADFVCVDDYKNNGVWFISLLDTSTCYKVKYPENHNINIANQYVVRLEDKFYFIDGVSSNLYVYRLGDTSFYFIESLNSNIDLMLNGLEVWPANRYKITFFIGDSLLAFPCLPRYDVIGKYAGYNNQFPLTAFYNIKNKRITFGKFLFPTIFDEIDYGMLTNLYQVYDNKGYIYYYSFAFPQIYKYNVVNHDIDTIVVRSKYQIKDIPYLSKDSIVTNFNLQVKHYEISPHYKGLYISPDGNYFYRLFKHELLDTNLFNFAKKDITINRYSVIIFDRKGNILSDVDLPKDVHPYCCFASNDGFSIKYFPPGLPDNDGMYWVKVKP